MGIKKYNGDPGIDGKFPAVGDAKYIGSGKPVLTNCIAWYKADTLDKSDNVWPNSIQDNVTWSSDTTYITGDYVFCPGIFKSLISSNTQSPFNPDAWEQVGSVWVADKTYASGDYCVFQNRCFQSQAADNLGNQPPIAENYAGTYWEESGDAWWWNPGSYSVDNLVIMPAVWLCMDSAANYFQPQRGLPLVDMISGAKTPWDESTTYNTGDYAFYDLTVWRSDTDSNIGNIPAAGSSYWSEVDLFLITALAYVWQLYDTVWDRATTYTDGDCVRYNIHIYQATPASGNLNQNPVNNPTYWEDKGIPENVWQLCDVNYWASGTTYDFNSNAYENLVWHNGSVYISLQSSNTGNNPITADTYWSEIFTIPLPDVRNDYRDYRCPVVDEYDHRPVASYMHSHVATTDAANLRFYGGPASYTITDYTIVVVFNPSENGNNYIINRHFAQFSRSSGNLYMKTANPDYAFSCSTGIALVYNNPLIATLGWSTGEGAYARVNGVELASQDGNLGSISKTGYGGVNEYLSIVGGGNGDLAGAQTLDFLMFNRKLSSTEIEAVENFLLGKWGLSKFKTVTASGAGNSDGNGTYLESTLSAIAFASNVAASDSEYNTMYTFSKYLQYNSTLDQWEMWHSYYEYYGPLPPGEVEGPAMQYVVSALFSMTDDMMGNIHYLLYNETDGQWEFWMFNLWYGEEKDMYQNLPTYAASGTSDVVPTSGWVNVSGISYFDTTPSVSTNF